MTKAEGDHLGRGNHPGTTPPPTVAATPNGATSGLFRKRPVVVEAVRVSSHMSQRECPTWLIASALRTRGSPGSTWRSDADGGPVFIATLGGVMQADVGDWIIRGIAGELYPCKPDIFAATYEPADADQREVTATGRDEAPGMPPTLPVDGG